MAFAGIPGKTFKSADNYLLYSVKSGDTLFSLTQKFDTTINHIKKLNPNINARELRIDEEIKLYTTPELKIYTVEKGDTLWYISKIYNYPLSQVIKLNDFSDPNYLIPGEIVLIPTYRKKVRSVLYFIKFTRTSAYLVPEERMIPVTHNFYASVIEELIKGPLKRDDANIPMIPETKVLNLYVKNGIAYLNFSNEIRRANVGSASEALLLYAIANSLTEFEEIKAVNILINGRSNETIGGHIELNRPIARSEKLIRYE